MSAFSEQLRVALDAADLGQAELAESCEISQPTISRYLKGEQRPEPAQFGTLLNNLPESLHFELIVAFLSDQLPKEYRDSVTILSQGGVVREDAAPFASRKHAPDLQAALTFLGNEAVQTREVRDLVLALARALGGGKV